MHAREVRRRMRERRGKQQDRRERRERVERRQVPRSFRRKEPPGACGMGHAVQDGASGRR